ncbi:MAG: hypothetical protein K6G73_02025 [Marinilabiliaceae bacterium]|nr:hypothetical protein [Marinilabiliaceae bacterium]
MSKNKIIWIAAIAAFIITGSAIAIGVYQSSDNEKSEICECSTHQCQNHKRHHKKMGDMRNGRHRMEHGAKGERREARMMHRKDVKCRKHDGCRCRGIQAQNDSISSNRTIKPLQKTDKKLNSNK